ncbi:DUF2946 family protein [Methylobacterium sp. GC_Met_2]|uniref:DUF2946 family protein n=1 Tax=Methylobacterium sp. GC_Met_2 TaxID=2937376 RepID=UPI00226B7BFD|nr:DUF2946 family protein [Methylobacterium sp. GC_Met_2]
MGRLPGLLGIALIALALWVQALAPVGALRMMLSAPKDLPIGILCGHGPDGDGATASVEQQDPQARACDLCQLCRAGLAPPPVPTGPTLARRLRWRAVVWPFPPPVHSQPSSRWSVRPRAPPTAA